MAFQFNRPLSRRTALRSGAAGLTGAAAFGLVGCGDDSTSSATTVASPTSGSSVPPTPSVVAKRGGTVRLNGAQMDIPDIHQANHVGSEQAAQWAIDQLMTYDEATPGDMKLAPNLAESLEQVDDQTYVYHLRKGVKFHNVAPVNGREMVADDVVFSLKRMATNDPRFTRRTWFATVSSIEAVDPYTVRIKTSSPTASLAYLIASPWVGIIPKEQADKDGAQLKSFIGTGPYINTRTDVNNSVQFNRNPDYWNSKNAGWWDNIDLVAVPDPSAQQSGFRAGQLTATGVPADVVAQFKKDNASATQYRTPSAGIDIIAMNNKRKPFDDVRIRQAIAYACDIPGWIAVVDGGQGFVTGPIGAQFTQWGLPAERLKYAKQDLTKSKQLFAAAGVDPKTISFKSLSIANVPTYLAQSVQLQADMKAIGITVTVEPGTQTDYTTRLFVTKDFDTVGGQDYSPDDPDRLADRFLSTGSGNYSGYANADLDKLFEKERQTLDPKARQQLIYQIQDILETDIPTFYTYVPYANSFSQGVTNWRVTAVSANDVRWNARNAWATG